MSTSRLAILAAALFFSTGGTAIKAISWDGFAVAGARSAIAIVLFLILMPRWRRFWHPHALLVGIGYGATMVLFVLANKYTAAANAIFLQSTAPLYVLFLGPWLLDERNRRSDWWLTGTLAIGMAAFFVGVPEPMATATDPTLGNWIGTAAGLSWALTLVGLRKVGKADPDGREATDLAGASVVAGNVLAVGFCLPFLGEMPEFDPVDVGLVAYLGVFQIGLAYVMINRAIHRVPALEVALLLLLEPVLSALIAWWVHGERLGPWALAGCAVIGTATVVRTILAARQPRTVS